jgi:coenzyme F420-dependent glucose-6-phosphate dehydrogenase
MRFVEYAALAEKHGFDTVWFGDHLLPWIHSQNKSAFVWSVISVAWIEPDISGVLVTSPIGGRYHPLIVGQAAATIDNLFPGMSKLGVDSGEAVNESNFFTDR